MRCNSVRRLGLAFILTVAVIGAQPTGLIAGPAGTLTWEGEVEIPPGSSIYVSVYRICDPDGIQRVDVFSDEPGGGREDVFGTGEHSGEICADIYIPSTHWGHSHSIVWTDYQTRHGGTANHAHVRRAGKIGDPNHQIPDILAFRSVPLTPAGGANGVIFCGPRSDGAVLAAVSLTGLNASSSYDVRTLDSTAVACMGGSIIKTVGHATPPNALGELSLIDLVPGPLADIYDIVVRNVSVPGSPTVLCGVDGDEDGDGIRGLLDNCQASWNPDQADADGDGIGNVCDTILINPSTLQPVGLAIATALLGVVGVVWIRRRGAVGSHA